MKPGRKRLTEREWQIMDTIWKMGNSVTVRMVLEELFPRKEKAYTTVQTMMNHLVEKGFLKRQKIGPINVYSPAIKRKDVMKGETVSFIRRVFGGSAPMLASYLIKNEDLTIEELNSLKELIDKRKSEKEEK